MGFTIIFLCDNLSHEVSDLKIKEMVYTGLFVALISIGAFIRIPAGPVPVTLQSMMVVLAGLVLGSRNGALACIIYIVLGLIGFPVFASGGGFAYVLMPSFGYLLGFVLAAWFIGKFRGNDFRYNLMISLAGLLMIYLTGILYFAILQQLYYGRTFTAGWLFWNLFLIYIPGDVITVIISNIVYEKLRKAI